MSALALRSLGCDSVIERALDERLTELDRTSLELEFWKQDELAIIDGFLPASVLDPIRAEVFAMRDQVRRKVVLGYKAAGSLSYYRLIERAPRVLALYHSAVLRRLCEKLSDRRLLSCPVDDPHGCAVYWYEQPGDRVGWHYDTSLYRGARYTLLLGLEDTSSARLQCKLHSREKKRPTRQLDVPLGPGKLVFFNGDKLLHAVSPMGQGERRVVLTMQLVTDPAMSPLRRVVSTLKDGLTYFGMDAIRGPKALRANEPQLRGGP